MPLGPPEDPDRFDDFAACVDALADGDMTEDEAEDVCGGWEADKEQGIVPVTDITQQDIDDIDAYRFYGIIQSTGVVCPVNIDHCIYYTEEAVENAPSVVGTELHVDHLTNVEGDFDIVQLGEVIDEKQVLDTRFGLFEFEREKWEEFTEAVEQAVEDDEEESGLIVPPYNQIVEDIDAGNLALSAGLGVAVAETDIHDFTVEEIRQWNEVSIVGSPASPGSYAMPCDGVCGIAFGEQQMSASTLDIDLETLQQAAEEGDDVASQIVEIAESDGPTVFQFEDGSITEYETEQSGECGCETEDLKQELKEVKEDRDEYQQLVEKIEQEQRDSAAQRLRNVNEQLPEEKQRSDEELNDLIEQSSVKYLNQTADMLEDVIESTSGPAVEEGKEDLGGTGSSKLSEEEVEQEAKKIDEVAQSMFGKDFATINDEIEEDTWGK